jgi:cell division protein FtsI/penicillin-binding protein 2
MALRTGNRGTRAGAHRAPRTGLPTRGPSTKTAGDGDGDGKSGVFGVRLRSRSTLKRVSAVVVLGVLVAAGLAHGGGSSPEPTVYQFLLDWEQGNYHGAAALTTGQPRAVAAELSSAYDQLDANNLVLSMDRISQHGSSATALFNASINLGPSGQQWKYRGKFTLLESGSTWRVAWSPSVIVPGLGEHDRLAVVQETYPRAQLLSASGQPLTVRSSTYEIGVIPGRLPGGDATTTADRLVAALKLPATTASQVAGQIGASLPNKFQELFTLPPSQYAKVGHRLARIPGVMVRRVEQRLYKSIAPDVVGEVGTETAQVLRYFGVPYRPGTTVGLSGLQQKFQNQLAGSVTTKVVIEDAQGHVPTAPKQTWLGVKGTAVHTTLDFGIQQAANGALAQLPGSGAIVAVQASTGKILAVASHQAGKMPSLDPLAGQYQPGLAFTIISAAALLATGHVTPAGNIQCQRTSQVDGRNFVNVPPEPASMAIKATFSKDFSVGCSTAFTVASVLSSFQPQLTSAAREFGIGVPWQLPMSGAFSGTIGSAQGEGKVAADAIGEGNVRVSALAMALAAGAADSGHWHAPSLVTTSVSGDPTVVVKETMSTQVLSELQGLMHTAVTHGSGSAANVGGNVFGQVGNAAFEAHTGLRISWFVGYRGDIAFAAAELVKSPSNAAASLAGNFLRNIRTAS